MSALRLEVIEEEAALERLSPDWWDLWRRTAHATPFQTPAWLLAWWRAFGPGRLHALAVRSGDALVALAPFYLEAATGRALPIGISVSDYLDVLADPAAATEALAAISAHIARSAIAEWHLPDLPLGAAALRLPTPSGYAESNERSEPCPVLTLAGAIEEAVPPRKLRKLRMALHRAGRRGTVRVAAAGAGSAEDFLDRLFALHEKRWRERNEPGVLADPAVRILHRCALPPLVAQGVARLFTVEIGGAVAGAYYGFQGPHGRAYAYLGGFDPEFGHESPGTILLGHAIAEAVREGAGEFHFLRGGEAYKYDWGASDRWNRHRILRRGA
ncbi:GNAT family N-acetyltransferase [Propylenella binzhouense]|uniref:GNAT family N-acetyltransferase n=1 Tax=Propylenella binzhouense TaxID=2555902 RepID=A0A964T1Y9_9HYPH|nr:GNAT family N-acetyltransferase [Propylenella binzhouense]